MLQFPAFPILSDQFGYPWLKDCMRLAKAYRSLPRPSSVVEPSYPLSGLHGSYYGTLAPAKPSADRQRKVMQGNELALYQRRLSNAWIKKCQKQNSQPQKRTPALPLHSPPSVAKKLATCITIKTPQKKRGNNE